MPTLSLQRRCFPSAVQPSQSSTATANSSSLRYLLALFVMLLGALSLAGCGGGWGEYQPTITTPLVDQTVNAGQKVTFTVAATGTGPLTYQWQKNGVTMPGATAASFSWVAQGSDNAASISVGVSNTGGTATSTAKLTVLMAPTIVTQPANQAITAGQTATFNVSAAGTAPLTYQWLRNGAAIPGATASSYTTPASSVTDSGATFSVTVKNTIGSVTSNLATLSVSPAIPSLAFAAIPAQTFGAAAFPVTATSVSTGAVTYSVVSGPATISGDMVTLTGVGNVVLSANQAASGIYAAATASANFAVGPETPTLTFAPITAQTYGAAPISATASSASPGAVTYAVVSGPATIAGNVVTLTGSGSVVLSASQAASGNYAAAKASTTFTVGAATPALTFAPIANQTTANPPFPVTATSASTGAVTYTVTSGPATLAGNTVTLTGVGTVVLGASQAAAGGYGPATASTTFTVAAGQAPTIAFSVANQTYGATPFPVNATSNSTGAITYSVTSGPATIAGNVVTLTGAGTVVLTANQAAAGNYNAGNASTSFSVGAETPTLSFNVGNQVYGNPPFPVNATSPSTGAITYAVVSGPATVAGDTVTLTGSGTVVLSANQAANGNYGTAVATTSFTSGAAAATLSFHVADQTFGNAAFQVNATSPSTAAITYAVVSGPATVSGNTVTLTGSGTVVLSASQAAGGNYTASTANASFNVATATPTLNFSIASQTYGAAPITVNATSPSSGAITYAVTSGPATVSGNTVTLTGAGTVVMTASQAAAGSYSAATASTSFTVGAEAPTLAFAPIPHGNLRQRTLHCQRLLPFRGHGDLCCGQRSGDRLRRHGNHHRIRHGCAERQPGSRGKL